MLLGVKPTPRPPRRIKSDSANDDDNNYEEGRLSSFLGNLHKHQSSHSNSASALDHQSKKDGNGRYPTLKPLTKQYHPAKSAGMEMSSSDSDENLEDMVEASNILSMLSNKGGEGGATTASAMIPANDLHVLSEAAAPAVQYNLALKRPLSQEKSVSSMVQDKVTSQQQFSMPISYPTYHDVSPTMTYFSGESDPRSPAIPSSYAAYDASRPMKQQRIQQEAVVIQ